MSDQLEEIQEPRGVAYSYVRFSTAKQELGDSLRRQVEACEKYCREHNLDLHPVSYRDLGVSAFKKKNIESGALAAFIDAVKTGKVAKGSYLVIEQFDRMSRADTDVALKLLLDLVHSGIRVVTLVDEKVWDKAAVKDIGNLILAIVFMSRANNESSMKASRLSAVWGAKKKGAADGTARRIVTSECPRWLAPNEDKTGFIVLHDRVESVKKVFEMRINGHGVTAIVSRANEEQWPCPGKPPVRKSGESIEDYNLRTRDGRPIWHTSNVGRLLHNRALLGEYQPHINDPEDDNKRTPSGDPILGYYPAVLDEQTFLRAQAKANRNGRFPGRRDASLKNWLQGLLRCTCGHSFVRKNKDSAAQPDYARYYCTARNNKVRRPDGTLCPGANAKELETAVLTVVSTVAPGYFQGTARMEELKAKADVLEVDVSAAKQTRDRYADAISFGKDKALLRSLVARVEDAEAEVARLERDLATARAEIADLSGDFDDVFENIVKQVQNIENLDARAKLREELSRVIEKVVVNQDAGFIEVHLRGGEAPVVQPLRPDAALPGLSITAMSEADWQASLARE
jgi:DNA invertase Pin-like site-specific DNA recombinase